MKVAGGLERIKDRLRVAEEFKGVAPAAARRRDNAVYTWDLASIRAARDCQLRGEFQRAVALAAALRTDAAAFSAYHNRIAPHAALATRLVAAPGARGLPTRNRAASSVIVARTTLQGLVGTMANHGIAIGYNEQEASRDGSRIDFRLTEWPLEHVQWNSSLQQLETSVDFGGQREPIVHGNGRWTVFRKFEVEPWRQEACILPAALMWAGHATAMKDWAAATTAHGQSKIVGELPEGWTLRDDAGNLTSEAAAFLEMLQDLVSGEVGAGVKPHGSNVAFVANGSNAWQVFKELATDIEKAFARIYLGTDAIMGSVGGAPGVDIAQLFGVATTKVQGDCTALEEGLRVGVYEPWTAINEGDSRNAPRLVYDLPDPDEQQQATNYDARLSALLARVKDLKEGGYVVEQPEVDSLARYYKVDAPQLAPIANRAVPLTLAPTDLAKVVRVDEARASQGLAPIGDTRGQKTLLELEAAPATAAPVDAPAAPVAP